jgi:energy-converting hydrogenase A subunit R
MRDTVAFDLEGPLSPEDIALDLMSRAESGARIFRILSRYDDVCALRDEDYEPGYTLSLIVPFLLHSGIRGTDLHEVSRRSTLVRGARELLVAIQEDGWTPYIVSTSYEDHARSIARRIGVPKDHVFCTPFPLDEFYREVGEVDLRPVALMVREMLRFRGEESKLMAKLTRFFESLRFTPLGRAMEAVTVMGGSRKAEAVSTIARARDVDLSEVACIGDSITDAAMLERVRSAGGLSVAFNANAYALPHAEFALAAPGILPFLGVLRAFREGGIPAVTDLSERETDPDAPFHRVDRVPMDALEAVHRRFRKTVRDRAASLG